MDKKKFSQPNEKQSQRRTGRIVALVAAGSVAVAGLTVYSSLTMNNERELSEEETIQMELDTDYDLMESDRHLDDTVEPLTFQSVTSLPAEESMGQLDAFLKQYSPNGFADYWTLRQFLSGNIQQVSDIVGSEVTLYSPSNIGADSSALLSDGTTECTVLLRSLSYTCAPA
jgi:hypothetical protein